MSYTVHDTDCNSVEKCLVQSTQYTLPKHVSCAHHDARALDAGHELLHARAVGRLPRARGADHHLPEDHHGASALGPSRRKDTAAPQKS